ncbi:PA3496 family putative envelope integrity protein [Atopomonas hussainii]|uniref:PA3496 family putative envelope integrity protein n=1 Tax=Atopomonas hussainii TaxID=1429083 RepID=UPI00090003EC|nr:hypothetical protein [Atopomonas hussainii]
MANSDSDIELEDDFDTGDDNEATVLETVTAKVSNLTKRRQIDNMLAERRLQKQISDYDFD